MQGRGAQGGTLERAATRCASSASTSGSVSAFRRVCCSFCSASSRRSCSWRFLSSVWGESRLRVGGPPAAPAVALAAGLSAATCPALRQLLPRDTLPPTRGSPLSRARVPPSLNTLPLHEGSPAFCGTWAVLPGQLTATACSRGPAFVSSATPASQKCALKCLSGYFCKCMAFLFQKSSYSKQF